MPLFVCDRCKAIENTALGLFATRGRYGNSNEALCSECAPIKKNWFKFNGKWHGQFEKVIATTEIIKEMGETNFVYVSDIKGVKAKNVCTRRN